MVRWPPWNFADVLRRASAVAVTSLLMIGPALLLSAWHDLPPALAAPGGNGKGNNGNGSVNGGPTGAHEDQRSAAKAKKDKKDKSTADSDANRGDDAGQADAGASEADKKDKNTAESGADEHDDQESAKAEKDESTADSDQGDDTDLADASADQAGSARDADQLTFPATAKRAGRVPTAAAPGRSGHDFVAGEVVVANMADKAKLAAGRLGFVLVDERRLPSLKLTLTRLRVPRAMTEPAARRLLASRFPGISVDVNALYRPQGTLVLPPPDYPTKLIAWGPVSATCGRGLRLGLLDTAVDTALPELAGADIVQRSFLTAKSAAASPEHGSAIAWVLVGRQAGRAGGLLPGVELAVAGVFAADPEGVPTADVVALVSGLDWLVGRRTSVINMSFAGEPNTVVALAVRRAIAGHAIMVAAAGNGGETAAPAFPAAEAGVIAATAVDSHAQPYAEANHGSYVAFAAPGVRVWTPGSTPAGSYHSGTSFATPFVTAAVAARLADGPQPDATMITRDLARTARDLGPPGKDPIFGWGLLRAASPCSTLSAGASD
jgi:hypothetical protein